MHMAPRPEALDLEFAKKVLRLDILSRLFDFERQKVIRRRAGLAARGAVHRGPGPRFCHEGTL